MFDWLKDILGEHYSEDIDKKVSQEIGKNFVSKEGRLMKENALPCLCLSARQAAGALSKYYDNAFSELGLSVTQIALLRTIARKRETNITRLAQSMRLDKSTLTRTLTPLITRGYICSERGSNRRETRLTLTERGNETAARAEPLWENAQADVIALLGGEEKAQEFAQNLLKLAGI